MRRLVIFGVALLVVVGGIFALQYIIEQGKPDQTAEAPAPQLDEHGHDHSAQGNESDPNVKTVQQSDNYMNPAAYPKSNPYGGLARNVIDSLRVMKQRYGITRDEYWPESGGVLGSNYLEVWYPVGRTTVTHGMRVYVEMVPARERFREFFGRTPDDLLVVYCMPELDVFKEVTGREWWAYSHLENDTMTVQPIYHLVKRGIAEVAIPHEYHQWAVASVSRNGAPRWLQEGLATHLAREQLLLEVQMYEFDERNSKYSAAEVESVLEIEDNKETARRAYYYSWRMVMELIDHYGEAKVRDAVIALGEGYGVQDGFEHAFGDPYDRVMEVATGYELNIRKTN